MLDYEKVAENTIRYIDSLSKEEWIALLKEGGLIREDGEPEVKNPHRPEQLLYGGDWYEEYFVRHDDNDGLGDSGVQEVDGIAQNQ